MKKILIIGLGILDLYLICRNSKLKGEVEELRRENRNVNNKADRVERYIGKLLAENRKTINRNRN